MIGNGVGTTGLSALDRHPSQLSHHMLALQSASRLTQNIMTRIPTLETIGNLLSPSAFNFPDCFNRELG
jgi:hypothetical protein